MPDRFFVYASHLLCRGDRSRSSVNFTVDDSNVGTTCGRPRNLILHWFMRYPRNVDITNVIHTNVTYILRKRSTLV